MNNFTKEELESIINWGEAYVEFGHHWSYELSKPLLDKIQSMIENYCEHPDSTLVSDCLDCGVSECRCNKCGHIIYEGLK